MNNFKKFFNKKVVSIGIFVIVLTFIAVYSTSVKSSSTHNLSGFMWSADNWTDLDGDGVQGSGETMDPPGGAGWISVNCTSGGNCASNPYGVTLETDGDLVGYAWSPYFGWLKFGGLTGFPIGVGTLSENAKIIEPGNPGCDGPASCVVGWARFCAGASNNSTCAGTPPLDDYSTGGWDGWVSLSGTGYGVTLSMNPDGTGDFNGYAWGGNQDSQQNSNTVGTGWITWNSGISGVRYIPDVAPYVLLSATPDIVPQGGTTVLSWEGYGLEPGNVCTATEVTFPGDSGWVSPPLYSSTNGSSFETQPLNQLGVHTFKISCPVNGVGGLTEESIVDVTVGIYLNLVASPAEAPYDNGYQVELSWNALPDNTDWASCSATSATQPPPPVGNGNNVSDTNWVNPISIPPASPPIWVTVPVNPTRFTITCTTTGGTIVSDYVDVPRGPIPAADIVFTNSKCVSDGGSGFLTDLTWSATNVEDYSCDAETDNPDTGTGWNWDNGVSIGSQTGVLVPASPAETTYKLKCTRESGGEIPATSLVLGGLCDASRIVKPHYKEN